MQYIRGLLNNPAIVASYLDLRLTVRDLIPYGHRWEAAVAGNVRQLSAQGRALEADRALLARTSDFLRSQPETAHGEFTLPMVTVGLRARRR